MTTKPMNRNAQRSHRMLEEAFIRLLAQKPYERITVSDVTRAAGLNRGTFYAHFNGMADLLEEVRETFSKALTALVEQVMTPSFVEDPRPVLDEIGTFLNDNRTRIQEIVDSSSASAFVDSLEEGVKEQVRAQLLAKGGDDAVEGLVAADYLAGGALRAYAAWLEGDYGACSIDELNDRLVPFVKSTCQLLLNGGTEYGAAAGAGDGSGAEGAAAAGTSSAGAGANAGFQAAGAAGRAGASSSGTSVSSDRSQADGADPALDAAS